MNALWYYAIGFVLVWVLALLFREQLKIDIHGPLLMRRTKRLRGFIDSVAKKSPRFWKGSMSIGVAVAVFIMFLTLYLLIKSITTMFQASVGIALPGVDIPGSPLFIPLGYGLIGLASVMIIHEFGHGILARAENVKIESIGVLLLAILPGAFVEQNEKDFEKSRGISKLRIYAAGSIFNMGLAAVAFALLYVISTFFVPYAFYDDGLIINAVTTNSPAEGVLQPGMIIHSVNGYTIKDKEDYMTLLLNKTKPGDNLTYVTDKGTFTITSGKQPNNDSITYPGTRTDTHLAVKSNVSKKIGEIIPWTLYYFSELLYWVFLLNFAVGTFNLLPIKPFDGGWMLEELLLTRLTHIRIKEMTSRYKKFLLKGLRLSSMRATQWSSSYKKFLLKVSKIKIPDTIVFTITNTISVCLIGVIGFLIIYMIIRGIALSL